MSAIATPAAKARPLLLAVLACVLLLTAAAALWIYYGTAVFFEIIRAGWMACF